MSDPYADGYLDGWAEAIATLHARFDLSPRDGLTGARLAQDEPGGPGAGAGRGEPAESELNPFSAKRDAIVRVAQVAILREVAAMPAALTVNTGSLYLTGPEWLNRIAVDLGKERR